MKDAKDKEGRSVKILGRAGLKFTDKDQKYFVDSEMLVEGEFDLVIYSDSVRYYKDISKNYPIPEDQKKEIVKMVVKLLNSSGIKTDVQP